MTKKGKARSKVLSDHRRDGKRLVPPWLDGFGPLNEVSWVQTTLPEVVWVACLHAEFGIPEGNRLALALAKATIRGTQEPRRWATGMSTFGGITPSQEARILEELGGDRAQLQDGLRHLNLLYPESPLAFLSDRSAQGSHDSPTAIGAMKVTLEPLFDKTSTTAALVQGTIIYIAFVTDHFKVTKDTSLADLPALEQYPTTELSQRVAAAVRATIPMVVFGPPTSRGGPPTSTAWSVYFWNRGLEIDPCTLGR